MSGRRAPRANAAAADGARGTTRVSEETTKQHVLSRTELQSGANVYRASLSADGQRALVCSLNSSEFWLCDVATGAVTKTFNGHTSSALDVQWSADGRTALSGSNDRTVRVWDTQTAHCQTTLTVGDSVWSVAWCDNERRVAAGLFSDVIEIWDIATKQRVRVLIGHTKTIYALNVSTDSQRLLSASNDKTVRLWRIDTGVCEATLSGHANDVYSAVWSGDGRRVLSASEDKTVRLWDATSGRCVRVLEGHTDVVVTVAWHPIHASVAASGGDDTTVRVWNIDTGACLAVLNGHSNWVRWYLHWSVNGQQLTSCDDDRICITWDLARALPAPAAPVFDQVQH